MINLLQHIYGKLSSVHPSTYLEKAPKGTSFPYVTFNMPTSIEDDYREDFILEIDIWDNKPNDTTMLETITTNIDTELNRKYENNSIFQCSIYRINRLMIPDPNESIRRRQLRYQVKTYYK